MKLLEIKDLFEINMSPGSLRSAAADIDARAGMEFEMIIPGAAQEDDDYDVEPDYDQDERIRHWEDIRQFFHDGDYNGRRDVDALMDKIFEDYMDSDWLSERKQEEWDSVAEEHVKDLVERDYSDDFEEQAREEVEKQTPEFGVNDEEFRSAVKEAYDKLVNDKVEEIMADMGSEYDEAYEEWDNNQWQEIFNDSDWIVEWLDSEGITTMSDVQNGYDITWPYYTSGSEGGDVSIEEVADDFKQAIGRAVNYSHNYHGGKRAENTYVVEPDGSLEPDDSSDGGLEFVSPPLPVSELLSDLKKVKAWADKRGAYTNDSTGLHINVSVPGWQGNLNNLDYVKLAVLLGDEYVLNDFGRQGNTYAKSAFKIVKDHIRQRPQDVEQLLKQMKEHLNAAASKLIHTGATSKYTSINTKDGYIEFRSPGGDWLGDNFDKIENTLLRFVVALDAAVDETKYREEYAKKLYKLLSTSNDSTDTLQYFVKFSAGELPKSALASFVRQAQLQRKLKKGPTGEKYWWRVSNPSQSHGELEVVASSKEEAIEKALQPDGYPSWANTRGGIQATPIRPFDSSPVRATVGEPQAVGQRSDPYRSVPIPGVTDVELDIPMAEPRAQTSPTGQWKIVDGLNREIYRFRPAVNTRAKANELAAVWAREFNFDGNYQVEPVEDTVQPGSTRDLQQQRSQGGFTGAWKIMVNGQEVHRFSGVGNVQADANRVAANWLRNNGMGVSGEGFEVVPVMG